MAGGAPGTSIADITGPMVLRVLLYIVLLGAVAVAEEWNRALGAR
jgi:hypothetical protein